MKDRPRNFHNRVQECLCLSERENTKLTEKGSLHIADTHPSLDIHIQCAVVGQQKPGTTLRYATLRYVTLRYATLRCATLRYATLRCATLR